MGASGVQEGDLCLGEVEAVPSDPQASGSPQVMDFRELPTKG